MAEKTAGFTVNEGTITQLLLSYLAGGFRGVGMWCWNCRTAGWEAGEYALLDRNNQPTARARRAGDIGKAMVKYRDELWRSRKQPLVGIFVDWDNEAIWAAMSASNRDKYRHEPVHARIGAARMLINANIPWEHVTAWDLRRGLSGRYRVIYMPAILAVDKKLFPILTDYVKQGGRLVVDMPGFWFDDYGRLLQTSTSTDFEKLFGVTLDDFQYSSNVPRSLIGRQLEGFIADVTETTAMALEHFDDGGSAITEHRLGLGSAVLIGFQASLCTFKPGNDFIEDIATKTLLGKHTSPYHSPDAIVYRLASPDADHYFIINDGPQRPVQVSFPAYKYRDSIDAVTGETIPLNQSFLVESFSGRWLRCAK